MTNNPITKKRLPKVITIVDTIQADSLSGRYIDRVVRFEWRFPTTKVKAMVTGAIREVHHDGNGTVYINLIPHDADEQDGYDKEEFAVGRDTMIEVIE